MSKGRKWYKKEEYNQPVEPFDPGDGSLIEVVKEAFGNHPDALKLTRVWPDGHVTTVWFSPPTKFSHKLYHDIKGDRKVVDPAKAAEFEESLQNGTYRPPYLQTSSVPGNKAGDTYDPATDMNFDTRARFNEYYKENRLEKVSANDNSIPKNGFGGEYKGNCQQYDPTRPLPVPPQFQGVKFYYGDS